MLVLPYDIETATGLAVAAEVGGDLNTLRDKFGNIDTTDLSRVAGINKTQIADRYIPVAIPITLLTRTGHTGTISNTPHAWTISATTEQTIFRMAIRLAPGQKAWLSSIVLTCGTLTGASTYPRLTFYRNGTAIPGGQVDLTVANQEFYLESDDPLTNPTDVIEDGDVITATILRSGGTSPTVAGIEATITLKVELIGE